MKLTRAWLDEHTYGNGTTEECEGLAERVSGQGPRCALHGWLHGTGEPPAWW